MPHHYLNQCWNIVNSTLRNKFQWNNNQNSYIFMDENVFEEVVCEMAATLSLPQCVKGPVVSVSMSKMSSWWLGNTHLLPEIISSLNVHIWIQILKLMNIMTYWWISHTSNVHHKYTCLWTTNYTVHWCIYASADLAEEPTPGNNWYPRYISKVCSDHTFALQHLRNYIHQHRSITVFWPMFSTF